MHGSTPYVGLPWQDRGSSRDGIACWGLARLVYVERLELVVPDYAAECGALGNRSEVAGVFAEGTMGGLWVGVSEHDAREFDIAAFRVGGLDAHVGIVAEPGRMLHITSGQESCIVDYTTGTWAPRLSGLYRHHAMMGEIAA